MLDFSIDECKKWIENSDKNPKTGRSIKSSGSIFCSLKKSCDKYGLSSSQIGGKEENNTENIDMQWNEENNKIFKLSKEHMKYVLPQFVKGNATEKKLVDHIKLIIESKKNPLEFSRSLRDISDEVIPSDIPYHDMANSALIRELTFYNCHDGQRKLTLGFLDFISKSINHLKCTPNDIFVVYAGSSGLASAIGSNFFPGLQMALYDPNPNIMDFLPLKSRDQVTIHKTKTQIKWSPLMIFTDKAGWFNDNTVKYLKNNLIPESKRKYVVFISDIRAETGEINIAHDMRSQMRWTMMLKSQMYMHKFRLPYFDDENQKKIKDLYENLEHIYPYLKPRYETFDKKEKDNSNAILYLDGDMMIQPYGPPRTTECRLIGCPHSTKGYQFRYYNVKSIENKIALFNSLYRSYASYKKEEYNYTSSFEKIGEFEILMSCLNTKCTPFTNIRNMYEILNDNITEIVREKANMDECKFATLTTSLKKSKKTYKDVVPKYFDEIFVKYAKK